jgi:hypothetical protein
MLCPARFIFPLSFQPSETIDWPEIIKYRTFYRLLQEINSDTLVVVNECLRTQSRHDLTYNCIRQYLAQTKHVLVFQTLPLIDEMQDFMILFDFATRSKWKRDKFDADLVRGEAQIMVCPLLLSFSSVAVPVTDKLKADYAAAKQKLFAELGVRDPHTIPRNLYLLGGKAKAAVMEDTKMYLGRNNRIGAANLHTFDGELACGPYSYTVFEFPHNFLNFSDVVTLRRQAQYDVLTADLPVDRWYLKRYSAWAERIANGYAALQ